MTTVAALRRAVAITATMGLLGGCAQIITRSSVEVMPRDAAPLVIGPPGGEITGREVAAGWKQDGDRLTVRLEESRTCNSVRHVPVVRIERVDRKTAGGAMWLEYGLGAGALAAGLVGLIKPEWFSQASTVDTNGQVLRDKGTGYRIGGILTGIGVALLTAAVIDTVRTRDEVRYSDAYRREQGGTVQCMDPLAPVQAQTVELLVGKWSTVEPTDEEGGARFLLPGVEDLPEAAREVIAATEAWEKAKADAEAAKKVAEEAEAARLAAEADASAKKGRKAVGAKKTGGAAAASGTATAGTSQPAAPVVELGPRPEPVVVKGVLRIDNKRALAVDFVVPYAAEAARGHEGRMAVEAGPGAGRAPGKRKGLSLKGAGVEGTGTGTKDAGKGAGKSAGGTDTDARGSSESTDTAKPAEAQ
jgi:hypothetical protein